MVANGLFQQQIEQLESSVTDMAEGAALEAQVQVSNEVQDARWAWSDAAEAVGVRSSAIPLLTVAKMGVQFDAEVFKDELSRGATGDAGPGLSFKTIVSSVVFEARNLVDDGTHRSELLESETVEAVGVRSAELTLQTLMNMGIEIDRTMFRETLDGETPLNDQEDISDIAIQATEA